MVQGEYIEFCLSDTNGQGDHEYQAGNVNGINGGKLMCETRRESRTARYQYRSANIETSEPVKLPKATPPPRARGEGPRGEGPRGEGPRGEGPRGESDREWAYASKTRTRGDEHVQRSSAGRGAGRGRGRPARGQGRGQSQQA